MKPVPIIARRNNRTGEVVIPICWQGEWFVMPIFAIDARTSQIWRRGWRKVAKLVGEGEPAPAVYMNGG